MTKDEQSSDECRMKKPEEWKNAWSDGAQGMGHKAKRNFSLATCNS